VIKKGYRQRRERKKVKRESTDWQSPKRKTKNLWGAEIASRNSRQGNVPSSGGVPIKVWTPPRRKEIKGLRGPKKVPEKYVKVRRAETEAKRLRPRKILKRDSRDARRQTKSAAL